MKIYSLTYIYIIYIQYIHTWIQQRISTFPLIIQCIIIMAGSRPFSLKVLQVLANDYDFS